MCVFLHVLRSVTACGVGTHTWPAHRHKKTNSAIKGLHIPHSLLTGCSMFQREVYSPDMTQTSSICTIMTSQCCFVTSWKALEHAVRPEIILSSKKVNTLIVWNSSGEKSEEQLRACNTYRYNRNCTGPQRTTDDVNIHMHLLSQSHLNHTGT